MLLQHFVAGGLPIPHIHVILSTVYDFYMLHCCIASPGDRQYKWNGNLLDLVDLILGFVCHLLLIYDR